jgi:hypothetical protein
LNEHENVVQLQADEQLQEEHDDVHVVHDDLATPVERVTFEVESRDTTFDLESK